MLSMAWLGRQCFEKSTSSCWVFHSCEPIYSPVNWGWRPGTSQEAGMPPLGHTSDLTLGSGRDSLCSLGIRCQCPPHVLLSAHRFLFGVSSQVKSWLSLHICLRFRCVGEETLWETTFHQCRMEADVQTLLLPFFPEVDSGSHSIGFSGNLRRISPHCPLSWPELFILGLASPPSSSMVPTQSWCLGSLPKEPSAHRSFSQALLN